MKKRNMVGVDRALLSHVKRATGRTSSKAIVDEALECLLNQRLEQALKKMKGIGWYGDLEAMRLAHPSAMTVAGLPGQE